MNFDSTDFSKGAAFVDGRLVPISEAKISILDWGFLHSDATYDVAHVWNGKFFLLESHIDRFFAGMDKLRMAIPHCREGLRAILMDCVRASGIRDAYVEIICTRGLPAQGSRDPRTCTNQFFAFVVPFVWISPPEKPGLNLVVSSRQRISPESIDPTVKNYHWLDLVMGQFEAYDRGAETAAVVDARGNLVEGPGFNIFAVHGRTLTTPARGMLEGITRRTAIELGLEQGYEVVEGELAADKARSANEIFVTSTAGGIMAVSSIDGQTIGQGAAGPVTRELQQGYWGRHDDPQYTLAVNYE
jgi:branched-chain amino acid aminotransferase